MTEQHEQTRDLASRALRTAEDAERLAVAATHSAELLEQRMDNFEKMDAERRTTIRETLARMENGFREALQRIESGVAGLYKRGWNFALTITGGLFAAAGIIAGVAYWLGQTVGKIPTQ